MPETLYKVGKIVNTHGIKGEIKVLSYTDFPEVRFAKGSELMIVPEDGGKPVDVTVQSARLHKICTSSNWTATTILMMWRNLRAAC